MSGFHIFEIWLGAFFTLALFSFMYKDNPFYKIAEHIFAGLTAGYQVGLIWDTVILQQLWHSLSAGRWWFFVPGVLGILMFTRMSKNYSWVSRVSLAFVMGVTAGIFLISQLHGLVLPQMRNTMVPALETVATVNDPYTQNHNRFLIATDPADTTKFDSLSTAVSPAISSANVADTMLAIVPGQLSATPNIITTDDRDSVTIRSRFIGPVGTTTRDFLITMKMNRSGNAIASGEELVKAGKVGSHGLVIDSLPDRQFEARYTFVPKKDFQPGLYDFAVEVNQVSIMYILTIIIVAGVLSTLIYFYFSKPHTGALGVTAKVGIWFIMIAFGAHFGYTVMGRVSLLIGRVQFLINDWMGSFSHLF